jgi:D-alanyl-D-alanine carboxypeptidase
MVSRPFYAKLIGVASLIGLGLVFASPATARENPRFAQIVVDADTHEIIYEENAGALRRPASITKVMTLYLLFDALKKGTLSWNEQIVFSSYASRQQPSKLGVQPGGSISVQTAIEALVVRSANDVAAAVAERVGGSETNFAVLMTAKARELGMKNTTFGNASGLPHPRQFTTAEDLARLAIAIKRDFPDQYHWFSTPEMTYNGRIGRNHNHLMRRVAGMDGLKTGYTRDSGFNLAATTQRGGKRVVTVVMGGVTRHRRDAFVEKLTESAFVDLGITPRAFAQANSPYEFKFRESRDGASSLGFGSPRTEKKAPSSGSRATILVRTPRTRGFDQASFMMAERGARIANPASNDEDIAEGGEADTMANGVLRNTISAPTHYVAASSVQDRPNTGATGPRSTQMAAAPNVGMPVVRAAKPARPVMVFPATQTASLASSDKSEGEVAAPMQLASLSGSAYAASSFLAGTVTSDAVGEPFKVEATPTAKEHAAASSKPSKREEREHAARATASKKETERQALARKARGDAVVQVGAFRSKKDAKAALAQLSKHFPSFAEREISSFKRRDGVWYRARFAGLATSVARDACSIVSRRGGTCKIIAR